LKSSTAWPHTLQWGGKQRKSGFFYMLVVDVALMACIATAVGFGTLFTPWSYNRCSRYKAYDSWPPESGSGTDFQDECRRGTTIQALAIVNMYALSSISQTHARK
jgi:hypothetical protein